MELEAVRATKQSGLISLGADRSERRTAAVLTACLPIMRAEHSISDSRLSTRRSEATDRALLELSLVGVAERAVLRELEKYRTAHRGQL